MNENKYEHEIRLGQYNKNGNTYNINSRCFVEIEGTGNSIYVGKNVRNLLLNNVFLHIRCVGSGNSVYIDSDVTYGNDCSIIVSDGGSLYIGKDCMLSNEVRFNIDGEETKIGNHVWFGIRSNIVGHTRVGSGSIIGACAYVKGIYSNNVVLAGNPCKIIKSDIAWGRLRDEKDIKKIPIYYRKRTEKNPVVQLRSKKMSINIITIGSKVLDDIAIASKSRIINKNRITDINPVSFCEEWDESFSLDEFEQLYSSMDFSNDYEKKMFEIDFGRNVKKIVNALDDTSIILFDLTIIRIPVYEFVFSSGKRIYITYNNVVKNNLEKIRGFISKHLGEITSENVIDMFKLDDDKIKVIVDRYIKLITDNKKIVPVCVDVRFVSHYISKRKTVEILNNQNTIYNTNSFFDKLFTFMDSKIQVIKSSENIWGDENCAKPHVLNYNSLYLNYLVDAVLDIDKKDDFFKKYEIEQKVKFEEIMMIPLAFQTNKRFRNRKIVIIGESLALRYILARDYGIEVYKKINYEKKMNEQEILDNLKDINGKNQEYFCVIPNVYGNELLRALWKCGYGYNIGYCSIIHTPYRLENFIGHYEDIYNNSIDTKCPVTIEIRGAGNEINIGFENYSGTDFRMVILSGIVFNMANKISIDNDFSLILYDGASVSIGANSYIKDKCHIRGSFNSNTEIGENTLIEEKTIIFNGDGHAIIDLHTGENINYAYKKDKEFRHSIYIGNECKIEENSFILSGTHLEDFSIVTANSFVNRKFESGAHIGGMPAIRLED